MDCATPRSLVLIDEFGKGTLMLDGAGLLVGVIDYFARGIRPRMVVVTHLHEIFTEGVIAAELPLACYSMEMRIVDGSVCFLYRLVEGISKDSGGLHCAVAAGLPEPIIARCRELRELFAQGVPPELIAIHQHDDAADRQLCQQLLSNPQALLD